jgi:hypothetical protein
MKPADHTSESTAEVLFKSLLQSLRDQQSLADGSGMNLFQKIQSNESELILALGNALKKLDKSDIVAMLRDRCLVELGQLNALPTWVIH